MRAQRIRAVAWGALATASLVLAACGGGSPASSASASSSSVGNGGAGSSTSGSSSNGATASHSPAAATDLSWPQVDGGPARTGDQPGETLIGTENVSGLSEARSYPTRSNPSAPLIVNGILYVDAGLLYAFDATGATGCSAAPGTCTPLWTASTAYFHGMAIADGKVLVSDAEGVQAFDAAGAENCSGTPKVCSPLWATSTKTVTGPPFVPGSGSPVVVGDVLYVPGYGDGIALSQGGALVAAFDAAGRDGCSGTPVICVPMWTTSGLPASSGNAGSPAVANGVLYIANSTLYAFDANGSQACTGTPKVCGPLWTAAMTGSGATDGAPAVADGNVYVGTFYTGLYAFDAAGSRDCSAAAAGKTCAPLWHAPESSTGSIDVAAAVADGVVYVVSGTGTLTAFAAQTSGTCPGTGDAQTCTVAPLWTGTGGVATSSSPVVADGVVYVAAGGTYAFDAAGSRDCTAAAAGKTCTPLWKSAGTFAMEGSLAVVDGVLYVNVTGDNTTYAYKL